MSTLDEMRTSVSSAKVSVNPLEPWRLRCRLISAWVLVVEPRVVRGQAWPLERLVRITHQKPFGT
jgi:hypothetical protein